jgi:microcystin-dependent protein
MARALDQSIEQINRQPRRTMPMEPFIGEIRLFPYTYAPRNWAECDGSLLLPINSNQALFSLLGTEFGGDGWTTFALPNLSSPPPGLNQGCYFIALQGAYPSRD